MSLTNWSRIWSTTSGKVKKCNSKICIEIAQTRICQFLPKNHFFGRKNWINVEPGERSISDYEVSKKLIHFLRHGRLHRKNDGSIEFQRIEENLQEHFLYCHWVDDKWRIALQEVEETRKCTRIVLIRQEQSCIFEFFKAIQECSPIDPNLWDNVVIPSDFFQCISCVACAINLHSIINSGLMFGGQNLNFGQTVFFSSACGSHGQELKRFWYDRFQSTASCTIHAYSWKRHQNPLYWSTSILLEERNEVLSNTVERY